MPSSEVLLDDRPPSSEPAPTPLKPAVGKEMEEGLGERDGKNRDALGYW